MELIKKIARVVEIGEQASGYMTIHVIKKNTETRFSRLKYDLLNDINWLNFDSILWFFCV